MLGIRRRNHLDEAASAVEAVMKGRVDAIIGYGLCCSKAQGYLRKTLQVTSCALEKACLWPTTELRGRPLGEILKAMKKCSLAKCWSAVSVPLPCNTNCRGLAQQSALRREEKSLSRSAKQIEAAIVRLYYRCVREGKARASNYPHKKDNDDSEGSMSEAADDDG